MKTLKTLKQQLLNGLTSEDFGKYVDLVNENLNSVLEDFCEDYDVYGLQWIPNDYDAIAEFLSRNAYEDPMGTISYIKSVNYNECADFVEYNGLRTMDYEELRDLYVKELFSDYYADILTELLQLEEVSSELFEELGKLDATQAIRNQIVTLLTEDKTNEVLDSLLPVLETHREFDYYLPHDKDSLEYLFENVFRNDLAAFTNWITSDEYSKSSYLNCYYRLIVCVSSLEVYDDLTNFVRDCSNEVLDEMIAVLDELQLW
jgi:hypothetical protein